MVLIENHRHLSPLRTFAPYKDAKPGIDRSAFYAEYNTNKRCIALDITKPRARDSAETGQMGRHRRREHEPGDHGRWGWITKAAGR